MTVEAATDDAETALAPAVPPTDTASDPLWYKDAVIYELHIKAFADANGDGIGDFRGLTERLDYVQALGVNTIWLLPFYPSPQRDDGYDVADYEGVNPNYGTLDDFRAFVVEAHRRGLRVITELVVNHTSDQHPWFQAARRAPKGSPERDFYVWSDDNTRYAGTRIIFTDTEKSNWTWDEVAQQYYWHRFFSHQPDLNFDNPLVLEAVLKTMAFWLDMGVDGFRLDAIPYLVERDGTSNENLRETHAVIKAIRAAVEARYPGRLLLAEANMWPEDVREYFGDGDECHMAYHFPLMPRMYMAIAQEDRHPIVEILAPDARHPGQLPVGDLPAQPRRADARDGHQQGARLHVPDVRRRTPRARINLGIRRRLAPLLENDRARIELMNGLLLSMPGTPVLYYGDEIGMGDNIYPRRPRRRAHADAVDQRPQRRLLARRSAAPVPAADQDPIYGFEAVNVEAQAREPSSLMNWTRRLLAVRSGTHAFGRGRFTMLHPGNRKVLAYVREHGEDVVLCVFNLSRVAQPVELGLEAYKGRVPVEMLGRSAFPTIGELPYLMTLPAHGFFWFRLATDAAPPQWHVERLAAEDLPVLVLFDGWNSFFRGRAVPWRMNMAEKTRLQFECELMPRFMLRQRWYAAKGEPLQRAVLAASASLQAGESPWLLALVDTQGPAEPARYFAPLVIAFEEEDEERVRTLTPLAVTRVRQQATMGVLADAMGDERFCRALVEAIGAGRQTAGEGGTLRFSPTHAFQAIVGDALAGATPLHRLTTSSNSISLLGDRLFLKCYRRLQAGIGPELEMGRFLTDVAGYEHCVPVAGSVEFVDPQGAVWVLALLQAQVVNQGDAWSFVVDQLARLLESQRNVDVSPQPGMDAMAERVQMLARRVAELHLALARRTGTPAFEPEPVRAADLAAWSAAAGVECARTLALLRQRSAGLGEALAALAARVVGAEAGLGARIAQAADAAPIGLKTRLHGDLHLQQVLLARDDFLIIDFEGEPQRSLAERRAKHSALRDVAGMLRSFDYARHTALHQTAHGAIEFERLIPVARQWERRMRDAFVQTYREVAVAGGLYASEAAFDQVRPRLDLFELEKALYELRYELDNRPDWVGVPLAGIAALAGITE